MKAKELSIVLTALVLTHLFYVPQIFAAPHKKEFASKEQIKNDAYHFKLKEIPNHAWGDIKNTFWGKNGLILLLGTASSLGFLPADESIRSNLNNNPTLSTSFDKHVGQIFSPYTIGGASLVTFIVGTQVDNPRFSLASESLMESWTLSMGVTAALKYSISRKRPNGSNYSMPSAHTAAVFSTATVLSEFYGIKAAIPSYAIAGLVAYSRIDGHYHNLTDVLIGALIGTVSGIGTSEFHKQSHANFFLIPEVSNNSATLTYYKNF